MNEGTPLREREALLRTILEPIPTFAEVVPTEHVRADDEQGLLASLGRVVRAKQEGLVIKRLDAPYLPNGRASWFKLKPAAIPGVGDTLTLGLIGVRVGNGVNAGKVTAFALGAIQNIHAVTEAGEPPRWALVRCVVSIMRKTPRRIPRLLAQPPSIGLSPLEVPPPANLRCELRRASLGSKGAPPSPAIARTHMRRCAGGGQPPTA